MEIWVDKVRIIYIIESALESYEDQDGSRLTSFARTIARFIPKRFEALRGHFSFLGEKLANVVELTWVAARLILSNPSEC